MGRVEDLTQGLLTLSDSELKERIEEVRRARRIVPERVKGGKKGSLGKGKKGTNSKSKLLAMLNSLPPDERAEYIASLMEE